jgi:rod shape-determining protein MreB and related proteins
MFSAVLGFFSQDLAVDLGTSNTRVFQRGVGVVRAEPTVISVHTTKTGQRRVMAIGDEALPMLGRTPDDIEAIRPVRNGQIGDYEVAEAFLLHLVRRVHGRNRLMSPKMVVSVPNSASEMSVRAVRDSCEFAGARDVQLVCRSVAAALGADLPILEPSGCMVVDIGGGATEVAMLSMSDVVCSDVVTGGGEGMDEAIIAYLKRHHGLLVGFPSAERLKVEFGSAWPDGTESWATVKGRCLHGGTPRAVRVTNTEIRTALTEPIAAIAKAIVHVLDIAPPELASDVLENGVVLTGGGALLKGVDTALRHMTGLPVVVADDPMFSTIRGAGRVLEETDLRRSVVC